MNPGLAPLQKALSQGRSHHCYVLSSNDSLNTVAAAHEAVEWLLASPEIGALRADPKLRGRIERRVHPDLLWLAPEEKIFRLEDLRGLQEKLAFAPLEASRRVVVLEHCEYLAQAAANSLLKILEEPPSYAVFLLLTSSADRLLATIRSRAQVLRLLPFSPQDLEARLCQRFPDLDSSTLQHALEWGQGSLAESVRWAEDGDLREFVGQAKRAAQDLFQSRQGLHAATLRFVEGLKSGTEAELVLQTWQMEGRNFLLHSNDGPRVRALSRVLNQSIARASLDLEFHGNPKMTLLGVCAALNFNDNRSP